jgi:hypothetical protein
LLLFRSLSLLLLLVLDCFQLVLGVFNALWWLDSGVPIHPPTGIKHGQITAKTNKDTNISPYQRSEQQQKATNCSFI